MKRALLIFLPAAALMLILTSFQSGDRNYSQPPVPGDDFVIPEDVSAIFDKSCFGCHNVDAQSEKARKKLLIDQLGELSKAKLVGKLGEIGDVVSKNEMPPEKFLQKYPDKALTEEESIRLVEWTEEAANDLMK
jgi:hypothetical protein